MPVPRSSRPILSAVALTAACALFAVQATAQDAKSYYKDKTVKIIVGFGPGGGYDAYARIMAPEFKKALGANVIVENQPGAGGLSALNRLYVAPPDGLQMMLIQGTGAAMQQLLGQEAVRFDLAKFGYLGIVSASPWMWLVKPTSTLKNPADAMKPGVKLVWPASGLIDGLGDGAAITCHTLKLDCKIVRGYKGSSAAALSLTQGETDALYVSDTSADNYVRAKGAKAIAAMGREKSRFFKDTPTIFEAVKLTPEQQWWFDFRATLDKLGRVLVVPPGLPKERLEFLQATARTVLTDPQFVDGANKKKRYVEFVDPETTKKMMLDVISNISPEKKAEVRKVILGK
jgi:tripartite-type tricarboxylate transporter receptor subunit TctC